MNLIFDFDGTLADTLSITVDILNEFLRKRKLAPTSEKELREGGGMKGLIKKHNIPKYLIPYLVIYGRYKLSKHIKHSKTFRDLTEVVKKLSKKHLLGIITSNSNKNVETFLKNNKLDSYFDFIATERGLFEKHIKILSAISKYKLEHQKTVYIGDETRDIEAAKKAGVKCVGVTWGFESKTSLRMSNPDLLIEKPNDLLKFF